MKKCNEILAKIFLGSICLKLTEKFNATLAKTQKDGKKLTEKPKALFVFYFVGFYLNLTEKCNKKFWKRPFVFGPYKTNFSRYSWLDLPTTYLLKTATLL